MGEVNLDLSLLDKEKLLELDAFIKLFDNPVENLINVLHRAQGIFGYLPPNLQLYIARKLDIGAAKVNGVVTFYSFFTEEKTGKHVISVCMGTACYVKGAEAVLKKVLTELGVEKNQVTEDGLFSVKDVRCVGACSLAPIMTVGDKVFGYMTEDKVKGVLDQFRGELDEN
jgi:NADH-quinone oxidoreductase subunit E